MNRRTLLQGVLAFVGLSGFVQAKPPGVDKDELLQKMREAMRRTKFTPSVEQHTWQAYRDAEVEIREMCYAFLKGIRDPDLYWHVHAMRSAFQYNCATVHIDYGLRGRHVNVDFIQFGVYLPTWMNYSHADKQTFVNRQIGDSLVELKVASKITMISRGKDVYFVGVDHLRSMA